MLWLGLFGKLKAIADGVAAILVAVGGSGAIPYASIRGTTNVSIVGTTYATITGYTTVALSSGFALASNVLTCTSPGIYELSLNVVFSSGAGGGTVAYRINGGTEVPVLFDISDAVLTTRNIVGVKISLANNDTLDFRFKANTAGQTMFIGGSNPGINQISLQRISA